jgi:hypothetical protein
VTGDDSQTRAAPEPPDTGLRRVLTWTFIALAVTLLMTGLAVALAVHFFDTR